MDAVRAGLPVLWLGWIVACGGDGGPRPSDDNRAPAAEGSLQWRAPLPSC